MAVTAQQDPHLRPVTADCAH
jgi:hypothetical protein